MSSIPDCTPPAGSHRLDNEYLRFWSPPPGQEREWILSAHEDWDAATRRTLAALFGATAVSTLNACLETGSRRLIDLGCGIGRLMRPLCELGHEVIGLDISQQMLDAATAHLSSGTDGAYSLELVRPPEWWWPVPDGSVEVVYSSLCLQHVPERWMVQRIWDEIARVLVPGGVARLQSLIAPPNLGQSISWHGATYETSDEWRRDLNRAGLKVLESVSGLLHPDWHWVTAWKPEAST